MTDASELLLSRKTRPWTRKDSDLDDHGPYICDVSVAQSLSAARHLDVLKVSPYSASLGLETPDWASCLGLCCEVSILNGHAW